MTNMHEIAVRESPCSEPSPISVISQVFNLQQLHKYYRFFDCYIQLLANDLLKMRKKADDYFLKL